MPVPSVDDLEPEARESFKQASQLLIDAVNDACLSRDTALAVLLPSAHMRCSVYLSVFTSYLGGLMAQMSTHVPETHREAYYVETVGRATAMLLQSRLLWLTKVQADAAQESAWGRK